MVEPIRQTSMDQRREALIAMAIEREWPEYVLNRTPPFHPTDYHASKFNKNGLLEYVFDFEMKWFNQPSNRAAFFNFNKLQNILILPPFRGAKHHLAFRYDDGIFIIPAWTLAYEKPFWFTRKDTEERDLVVKVDKFAIQSQTNTWFWLNVKLDWRTV